MSTLAADVAAASHRFQMEYGHDATADNLIYFLRMEADAEERLELAKLRERMEKERQEKMRLERERSMYARVKFTPGGRLYNYEVAGCAVGDWIVVPPNSMRNTPSILEVVELGRGSWDGICRPAHKVPTEIAEGLDYGCAGGGVFATARSQNEHQW